LGSNPVPGHVGFPLGNPHQKERQETEKHMRLNPFVGDNNPALKSNNFNARRTGNTVDLTMRTALF